MAAEPERSSCCAKRPCIAAKELPFMKIVIPKSMANAIIIIYRTFDVMSPRHCGEHEKEIEMIMGG
jgi:hypothetical protein